MPELQNLESLYPEKTREKEISQLLSFVKNGKSSQVIALPGVGRGNMLGFLAYNRNVRIHHLGEEGQLQYHFVLVNFSEMRNRSLFDVMKFLFLELSSSLHERNREEEFAVVDKLFKDALSYQDELVIFQEMKKAIDYLALEKKLTITFLFERFETYVPQVTNIFFTNLRSLRDRAKYQVNFVFSTTRPLEDLLDGVTLADFYEYIVDNHVYLELLDPVGLEFRIGYLEKLTSKKLSDTTKDSILALTAGHGKLTRLALEYVFGNSNVIPAKAGIQKDGSRIVVRDDNLEETLLSQKTIQGALSEIWLFLTPDEQQDVLASTPNEFLQNVGLIKDNKITISLFQAFVAKKSLEKQPDTFMYHTSTNTIKKGPQTISDILTLSEFRLLALLLENPESVIDRERIIQSVWTDTKTQAGVSEQAVDQLVFRLRKKIEDDPNHPTHIQTIKGRGVKFTP